MTGVLSRLERDGMVSQRKAPEDQGRVFVTLTDSGLSCFNAMREDKEANYCKIQAQLGEDKLQQLMVLLSSPVDDPLIQESRKVISFRFDSTKTP